MDVAGLAEEGEPVVLVEAELRRQNPVANVVKVWMWARSGNLETPCVLIQAFTKIYRDSKAEPRRRAEFVGQRMQTDLCSKVWYEAIQFNYRPLMSGKVGGGRRRHHARELAELILEVCSKHPAIVKTHPSIK